MRCDQCGVREAVIHLTQVVENSITTLHLCEECAAEKGLDTSVHAAKAPLEGFLASLGKSGVPGALAREAEAECPECGATLAEFRRTGRLGCAACYSAFDGHLRDLLRRLHGTTRHAGESYGAAAPPADDLAGLRERLRLAVEAERFEEAARLRDAIRRLE